MIIMITPACHPDSLFLSFPILPTYLPMYHSRKGGLLAVTDANLMLGRVSPKYFPHIFGPQENEALDVEEVKKAFECLTQEVGR